MSCWDDVAQACDEDEYEELLEQFNNRRPGAAQEKSDGEEGSNETGSVRSEPAQAG